MQTEQLGEICEFSYGEGLRGDRRRPGKIPVYGSNGIIGWHDRAITTGPTIVVGRKGSIGEVHFSPGPCWPIDTTYFIGKPKKKCLLSWLYYILLALDLTKLNKAAAVPGLNREDAYRQAIPFPAIVEQYQIARQLEQADRLRRLRRYTSRVSDTFLQSVFLEMFGGCESGDWPQETIEDLAVDRPNAIRTGPFGSQLLHSEFVDKGVAVLGIDNVVQNRFVWEERRFITQEKYQTLKRYQVFPGDVLITLMGTCGRCAVVPEGIPLAINTKHLCCITLDQTRCLPLYLQFCFLNHPRALRQLGVSERGAVMPGLNMQIIKELVIPVPPFPLQQQFSEVVRRFERLRLQQHEAERQAEHLFQNLLHRAFSGGI